MVLTSPDERRDRINELANLIGAPVRRILDIAENAQRFTGPGGLPSGRLLAPDIRDFATAVQAGSELARGQLGVNPGRKIETISSEGGRLAVEAGLAATLDDGIVLFHQRITEDKPGLRRLLRKFDEKNGRLTPVKSTPAQKATRLAIKAGMVRRSKTGQIMGLTPAAQRLVKRQQSRTKAATNAATIKRQKRFAAQLRRLK